MASVRSAHADGRACERARHSLCAQGKLVHRRRLVERSEEGYARVRHRAPAQVLFVVHLRAGPGGCHPVGRRWDQVGPGWNPVKPCWNLFF